MFFMDQIEVLVYKYGIKDPKIINILRSLDLRFGIDQLCPDESQSEREGSDPNAAEQGRELQRRLERQHTRQNIRKLEHMMLVFRADQLFAPLYKAFSQRLMSYNRHFFVNLRRHAKLAPFRRLRRTVQRKVDSRLKGAFSQILFYVKPNLRLLLLIFAISKVKQRHVVDAFRRIYGFYDAVVLEEAGPKNKKQVHDDTFEFKIDSQKRHFSICRNDNVAEDLSEDQQINWEMKRMRQEGPFTNDFGDSEAEAHAPTRHPIPGPEEGFTELPDSNAHRPNFFKEAENLSNNFENDDMTAKINALQNHARQEKTELRERQDDHFQYYDSSLNESKKKQSKKSFQQRVYKETNLAKEKKTTSNSRRRFIEDGANPFSINKRTELGRKSTRKLVNLDHLRSALEKLARTVHTISRKNRKWGLIKLQEHYASSLLVLEVIESEDCTQEMNDMAGYMNMMDSDTGNITCVNTHLAKEKSEMFNEIREYYHKYAKTERLRANAEELGRSVINGSMFMDDGAHRRSMLQNVNRSQVTMQDPRQTLDQQNTVSYDRKGTVGEIYADMTQGNSPKGIEQSQLIESIKNPNFANNSMYMNSTMNFGSLMGSQVFPSNPNNHVGPSFYGGRRKKRETGRKSVLKVYRKINHMDHEVNESMSSRQRNASKTHHNF